MPAIHALTHTYLQSLKGEASVSHVPGDPGHIGHLLQLEAMKELLLMVRSSLPK